MCRVKDDGGGDGDEPTRAEAARFDLADLFKI
jgi:hypothetical protein